MPTTKQKLLHTIAAVLGGYAFTWGFISLGVAGLFAVGMEFHDAENLASMLGLLLFLALFLWVFSERNLKRIWLTLAGGGALMTALASLIQMLLLRSH